MPDAFQCRHHGRVRSLQTCSRLHDDHRNVPRGTRIDRSLLCSVDWAPIVTASRRRSDLQRWGMPSRGEVWWAFGAEPSPVVIVSSHDETDLRAIHVVPAAETDIAGVAIELPVGREEGLPSGVVRVALARQDRINCAWLASLKKTDLNEKVGALSEEKPSKLAEMGSPDPDVRV